MSWVPIHESGINYALTESAGLSMAGSTITRVSEGFPDEWGLFFIDGPISSRLRITILSYEETLGGEIVDQEARFTAYNEVTEAFDEAFNTAAFVDGVRSQFTPNPVILPDGGIGASELFYSPASDEFLNAATATYEMLVEVEVEGEACFWTDLLGVTQDCGAEPDPDPDGWPPFIVAVNADPSADAGINISLNPSFDGPCSFAAYADALDASLVLSLTQCRNAVRLDSAPICGETYTGFDPETLLPADSLGFDNLGGGVYNFPLFALQAYDPTIDAGDFVAALLTLYVDGAPEINVVGVFEVQGAPP